MTKGGKLLRLILRMDGSNKELFGFIHENQEPQIEVMGLVLSWDMLHSLERTEKGPGPRTPSDPRYVLEMALSSFDLYHQVGLNKGVHQYVKFTGHGAGSRGLVWML